MKWTLFLIPIILIGCGGGDVGTLDKNNAKEKVHENNRHYIGEL